MGGLQASLLVWPAVGRHMHRQPSSACYQEPWSQAWLPLGEAGNTVSATAGGAGQGGASPEAGIQRFLAPQGRRFLILPLHLSHQLCICVGQVVVSHDQALTAAAGQELLPHKRHVNLRGQRRRWRRQGAAAEAAAGLRTPNLATFAGLPALGQLYGRL